MFPPETWNVHRTALDNNHRNRTNNICESWNNRFCHLVGGKHPSIWTLITKIKNEMSADCAKLAMQNIGESKKPNAQNRKPFKKRLKTLRERLNANQIQVDRFKKNVFQFEKTTIK